MPEKTCIICGEVCDSQVKLPHGSFYIHPNTCTKKLNYLVNDATPILWLCKNDLIDMEYATREELENVTPEQMVGAGEEATDRLWDNDSWSEIFGPAVERAAENLKEQEIDMVKGTHLENLPLLIGSLKYKGSINCLAERMRKGI